MKALCTVLFVSAFWINQSAAEGDSSFVLSTEITECIAEPVHIPVADFQKSPGTPDYPVPGTAYQPRSGTSDFLDSETSDYLNPGTLDYLNPGMSDFLIPESSHFLIPETSDYLIPGSFDLLFPATASSDTTPGPATPHATSRLLPPNTSWMENGLWGESGFFRSVGIAGELTPESRKSELSARRTMLTIHQIGGFVTLGLMGATLYYGQKTLNDSNIPSAERTDQNHHNQFVTYTLISYGLTAMLAILSPPPLIRRDETSTTTIHKTLAWIHFAGMIITPILGSMVRKRSGHYSYIDLNQAHYHQVSAYITTAVFAASMVVITF